MRARHYRLLIVFLAVVSGKPAVADHPTDLDHLLRQVKQAHSQEAQVRRERERRFLTEHADRQALLAAVSQSVQRQRERGEQLKKRFEENEQALQTLQQELTAKSGNLGELFGTVRQSANDLHAVLRESLVSAQYPGRAQWFDTLAKSKKLPDISELERLWLLMQQEITESGRISRFQTPITDTDGVTQTGTAIRIGVFNIIAGDRFLRFLPEIGRVVELSPQPGSHERGTASAFSAASQDYATITMDPSRGGLLDLLIQKPTLIERVEQGGAVGYIIIALAVAGMGLVTVRLYSLSRISRRLRRQLQQPDTPQTDNPLGRVLLAAGDPADKDIDVIESLLDESILKETPALQRGLGLIKLLAAIAPLLGLLGTVTGMIVTFQSISLFGTGDPKLMAGGISQALITTVMGLVAAIPLLLSHTLLASRSRALIQILDEQSAGLIACRVSRGA